MATFFIALGFQLSAFSQKTGDCGELAADR